MYDGNFNLVASSNLAMRQRKVMTHAHFEQVALLFGVASMQVFGSFLTKLLKKSSPFKACKQSEGGPIFAYALCSFCLGLTRCELLYTGNGVS